MDAGHHELTQAMVPGARAALSRRIQGQPEITASRPIGSCVFWTMRVRVAAEAATRGPADGTDIAALVGLGADTLAAYLTKLLHALFAIIPATTAPNADLDPGGRRSGWAAARAAATVETA